MKTLSWVVLALVAALLALGSLASLGVAYFADPSNDIITPTATLSSLSLDPNVETALRARRGTAATMGLTLAVLLLTIVVGPYRQGAVWPWWCILISSVVLAIGIVLRIPLLGTMSGVSTGLLVAALLLVGLLLDLPRVRKT